MHTILRKHGIAVLALSAKKILACISTLLLIHGCQSPDLPSCRWQIALSNQQGKLLLVTTSVEQLFRDSPSLEIDRLHTLSCCRNGWLDQESGVLATLEEADRSPVIRLYDPSMQVMGEYWPSGGQNDHVPREPSAPVLLTGGTRIVFVDNDGMLIVGTLADRKIEIDRICNLIEVQDFLPRIACFWLSKNEIAIGFSREVHVFSFSSGRRRLVRDARLVGVVNGSPVLGCLRSAAILDSAGMVKEVRRCESRFKRDWKNRSYAGVSFLRISPDGDFLAYDAPSIWRGPLVVIRHIRSGREVEIPTKRFGGITSWGSWNRIADTAAGDGLVLTAASSPAEFVE